MSRRATDKRVARRRRRKTARHLRIVHTVPREQWDLPTLIREDLQLGMAGALGIPMDYIDGRPWVRTHREAHDPVLWGDGGTDGGCGHDDCDGGAGRNLVGLLNHPGVTVHDA